MSSSSTERMLAPGGDDFARQAEDILARLRKHEGVALSELQLEGEKMARDFWAWSTEAPPPEVRSARITRFMAWAREVFEVTT